MKLYGRCGVRFVGVPTRQGGSFSPPSPCWRARRHHHHHRRSRHTTLGTTTATTAGASYTHTAPALLSHTHAPSSPPPSSSVRPPVLPHSTTYRRGSGFSAPVYTVHYYNIITYAFPVHTTRILPLLRLSCSCVCVCVQQS